MCSLSSEKLCEEVVKLSMIQVAINFMSFSEERENNTIESINNNYMIVCRKWEDYDNFALISDKIIRGKFSFSTKSIAASILHKIAYDINRYSAQNLVKKLIKSGVEPNIENVLKRD